LSTDPKAQGGIDNTATPHLQNDHDITLMQRSGGRMGRTLSITTSWIKRDTLNRAGVRMLDGVDYRKINDDGVHITRAGETQVIAADTVILCAGQSPERGLVDALTLAGVEHEIIGGAEKAAELDAMRAIEQGVRAALAI
jgi:2,4-dienoyl-CoA reductase (NADPH2)